MKIAITAEGRELSSQVCPRFGRADYFIIVDPASLEFDAINNPNASAVGGAGIQSSQLMINQDVTAVLSGRVGTNAYRVLESAGIIVYENVEGNVKDAIEQFNKKNYSPSNNPDPGRNKRRNRGLNQMPSAENKDSEEIIDLKNEVDQLSKQLNEVNEKLNRLNK